MLYRYKKVRSIRENIGDTEETDQSSGDQSPDIKTEIETPPTTASSDIAGVSDEVVTELTTDQVNAEEKELAVWSTGLSRPWAERSQP